MTNNCVSHICDIRPVRVKTRYTYIRQDKDKDSCTIRKPCCIKHNNEQVKMGSTISMMIQCQEEMNGNALLAIVYIRIQSGTVDLATFIVKNYLGRVNDEK